MIAECLSERERQRGRGRRKTLNKHANDHSTFEMGIASSPGERERERIRREINDLARLFAESENRAGSEANIRAVPSVSHLKVFHEPNFCYLTCASSKVPKLDG